MDAQGAVEVELNQEPIKPVPMAPRVQTVRPKTTAVHRYVPTGTTAPVQLLPFQANRKAIILTPSTGANYTVSWDRNVTNGQGLTFTNSVSPMVLTDDELGSVITLPLFAIASSAARVIAVIEILYDEVSGNLFDSEDERASLPIVETVSADPPSVAPKARRKMRSLNV